MVRTILAFNHEQAQTFIFVMREFIVFSCCRFMEFLQIFDNRTWLRSECVRCFLDYSGYIRLFFIVSPEFMVHIFA